MKRLSVVALLAVAIGAGTTPAPAVADPQPVQPFVPGINEDPDLLEAWQHWQSKDIDDYVVRVRLSCFCPPEKAVRTVIRNDRTVRVTQGDRRLRLSRGWSMDELYSMIRDAQAEADSVRVEWTPRGVPSTITIDPEKLSIDEERYYSVSLSRLD